MYTRYGFQLRRNQSTRSFYQPPPPPQATIPASLNSAHGGHTVCHVDRHKSRRMISRSLSRLARPQIPDIFVRFSANNSLHPRTGEGGGTQNRFAAGLRPPKLAAYFALASEICSLSALDPRKSRVNNSCVIRLW